MTTPTSPEEYTLKLNIARRNLNTVLEDKAATYFLHLKQWFRMKISQEQFDAEARKMLTSDQQVKYHYAFLLALMNRVDGLAHTSISLAHERAFSSGTKNRKPNTARVNMEVFLPDRPLVLGRFMLAAWDMGLEAVEDDAANLVVVATQMLLKNVLQAVISGRRGYKKRGKYFMYESGADVPNMFLQNSTMLFDPVSGGRVDVNPSVSTSRSELMRPGLGCLELGLGPLGVGHAPMVTRTTPVKPEPLGIRCPSTIDEMEHVAAMESACSSTSSEEIITLTVEDVYLTLLEDRNIIASHTVYTMNLNRIANMLWHPST